MKLKKVVFDINGFRKLQSLEIEIADRLTVIGGLNGIGKSTLLGLIANASGVSGRNDPRSKTKTYIRKKSYFDLPYQANFQELFHLDSNDYNADLRLRGNIEFHYKIESTVIDDQIYNEFIKKCNVTEHSEPKKTLEVDNEDNQEVIRDKIENFIRYKIVPRSTNKQLSDVLNIGDDAKVPIPTIYLGMSRMTPIGEIKNESIKTRNIHNMHDEDKEYFTSLFEQIINYDLSDEKSIIDLDFKHSHKKFKIPKLEHNPFSISLGQDSLSSIFTALVSFYSLKREYKTEYKGGILVIDEIDAGLHHIAQEKLLKLLKKESRRLDLQIIFTTHSLTIFKNIIDLPKEQIVQGQILDKVIYFHDTHRPRVQKNPTYLSIKNNQLGMYNKPKAAPHEIKVYFEDDEAFWFYEQLLNSRNLTNLSAAFSVQLKPVSLKLSCSILLDLANADDFFKDVIIITDNDVNSELKNRDIIFKNPNILSLPGDDRFNENTPQKLRTPERIIYEYLNSKYKNYDISFWDSLEEINHGYIDYDYVGNTILDLELRDNLSNNKYRDIMKLWFKKNKSIFEDIHLIDKWAKDNQNNVDTFIDQLNTAIAFISSKKWQEL
jgi:predicted ATPase